MWIKKCNHPKFSTHVDKVELLYGYMVELLDD
jgi:hypothetical protein